MTRNDGKTRRPFAYLNMILTVIAALLALLLIRDPSPALSQAHAAASPGGAARGIQNPADQRFQMIAELRKINEKLDRLSGALKGPFEVNVLKMPVSNGGNTDGD